MVGPLVSVARPSVPHVATSAGSVDLVTDYAAFLDLEAEWNETVDRARIPHPFLSHEWVRTWWDCFGAGGRLHIVIVRADGRIAAIAPLMRETTQMYGVPVRRIRFLQNDHTPRTDQRGTRDSSSDGSDVRPRSCSSHGASGRWKR